MSYRRAFPVMIFFAVAACARGPNSTPSSSTSVGERAAVWPEASLRTCFDEESINVFSPEEKKIIRDAATEQYTTARTGVSFVGWDSCYEGFVYQVRLSKVAPPDPEACAADSRRCSAASSSAFTSVYDRESNEFLSYGLGHARKFRVLDASGAAVPDKFRYEAIDPAKEYAISDVLLEFDQYCSKARMRIPRAECIRGLALHELGHAAGLQHEQTRDEAKADRTCIEMSARRTLGDIGKSPSETAARIGDYDPRSIMNLCYLDAYESGVITLDTIALSEGDGATLRALYGVKP